LGEIISPKKEKKEKNTTPKKKEAIKEMNHLTNIFTISKLTKSFGTRTVLDISTLGIPQGGIHVLLGANGAGKTTLLEILSCLSSPSSGLVHFFDTAIDYGNTRQLHALRRRVVLVHQTPIMFSDTVTNNVAFGLKARGVCKVECEERILAMLVALELEHLAKALATTLSGGETQRIALARALILEPEVLLLDEPTANVDVGAAEGIERILQSLIPRTTLIMTSHNRAQSERLATSSTLLEHGRVIA